MWTKLESVVKVNEKCCIWKNKENLRNKIGAKLVRANKTIKMDIQTKLYVTQNI